MAPAPLQPRRLRGILAALAGLALAFGVIDLALRVWLGADPPALVACLRRNPDEIERLGQRLAGAEAQAVAPATGSPRPLGLVVGLSTAREGVDAAWLGGHLDPAGAVINLGSTGSGLEDLLRSMQVLRWTPLRPRWGILAAHPGWLAETTPAEMAALDRPDRLPPELRIGLRGRLRVIRRESVWTLANRDAIHCGVSTQLAGIRWWLMDRWHYCSAVLFPPSPDPWAPDYLYSVDHADPAFLQRQWHGFQSMNWFNPRAFVPNAAGSRNLAEATRRLQDICRIVVVVWMPERSDLRQAMPEVALRCVPADLRPFTVDARAVVPDSGFVDYVHLNASGRLQFTRWLAARLALMRPGVDPVEEPGRAGPAPLP